MSPQLVVRRMVETPERYDELRAWLAAEWRKTPADRDEAAAAVFAELGLDGEAAALPRWRPLVESETFVALLRRGPLAAAA